MKLCLLFGPFRKLAPNPSPFPSSPSHSACFSSTLHSPTSPIGIRSDSSDSDRILSNLSLVRSESELSPIRVRSESKLSPSSVRSESELSPIRVRAQSELSPIRVQSESNLNPIRIQSESNQSPIRIQSESNQSLSTDSLQNSLG